MGIGDFINQGKEALNNEQGENITDGVLDKAEGLAGGVAGGQFAEQASQLRDGADEQIGNE
ncbi:antitoxin [Brevibacterium samyangense]|uniref:Antitoxin n=1 Tax=Brevibacterium samyangense TaxID=366888 RepID=A0ABN2TPJ0_9MICO